MESIQIPDRLARLERQVAELQRTGWERDELPFYPTSLRSMPYEDSTTFTSVWETILAPRTATLAVGLVTIGDQVSSTSTGGEWQVVLNDSTVALSGTIAATFSYEFPAGVIDLLPYRGAPTVKVQIKARRTSGATTGGKWGTGGAVAVSPRYAQLL
ncbi:hypothetical protein AB0M10_32800 [Streptomyces sp. NPDC051840]|uniref:hypothetical protein n=1 Tax=Streptomyces sp. NPDC051840 TaxID=3154752 RepID=UPI00342781D5